MATMDLWRDSFTRDCASTVRSMKTLRLSVFSKSLRFADYSLDFVGDLKYFLGDSYFPRCESACSIGCDSACSTRFDGCLAASSCGPGVITNETMGQLITFQPLTPVHRRTRSATAHAARAAVMEDSDDDEEMDDGGSSGSDGESGEDDMNEQQAPRTSRRSVRRPDLYSPGNYHGAPVIKKRK